jgi:hypothetical protein
MKSNKSPIQRLVFRLSVVVLSACGSALAQGFGDHRAVQEISLGGNTEYNIINHTNSLGTGVLPFDIVAFAIRSDGAGPFTTNPGWMAQELNATSWLQPMGGNSANPSWLEYTRLTYSAAFPLNPPEVNGFVVDHIGSGPAIPSGGSLDGFFFQGPPDANDRFILVAAHGPAIVEGQIITDFGRVDVVPEPGAVALCLAGGIVACALRRCPKPTHA